ncbi:LysR substrate-binding domain-containing protein [Burkholderia sp. Ac-20345]|uniref:LysR substrate-binding domain-containing protein n=1 Tax=Burkholderia sp. Ac-20345 TaxID=2703891 RepID=UPI001F11FAC8|nr:LysR substrate-binding domain-containing protein [Burkholderia sp. Ac-20345]
MRGYQILEFTRVRGSWVAANRRSDIFPSQSVTTFLWSTQLGDELLAVVVGCNHPLADQPNPTFGELATYPWILQPRPSPMRALIDRSFEEAGVTPPQSTVETAAILMTTSLLPGSDLIAVLPMEVANFHACMGLLHILPVQLPRQLGPYGIGTRLGRPPSASMSLFIDVVRAVVAEGA